MVWLSLKELCLARLKRLNDFIVATEENMYYGIITVKDLLEKVIEIEVTNARTSVSLIRTAWQHCN